MNLEEFQTELAVLYETTGRTMFDIQYAQQRLYDLFLHELVFDAFYESLRIMDRRCRAIPVFKRLCGEAY